MVTKVVLGHDPAYETGALTRFQISGTENAWGRVSRSFTIAAPVLAVSPLFTGIFRPSHPSVEIAHQLNP